MDFDKWHSQTFGGREDESNYGFKCWSACKEQVLKILKEEYIADEDNVIAFNIKIMDRIKKL